MEIKFIQLFLVTRSNTLSSWVSLFLYRGNTLGPSLRGWFLKRPGGLQLSDTPQKGRVTAVSEQRVWWTCDRQSSCWELQAARHSGHIVLINEFLNGDVGQQPWLAIQREYSLNRSNHVVRLFLILGQTNWKWVCYIQRQFSTGEKLAQ